jgi:hypothetical protein
MSISSPCIAGGCVSFFRLVAMPISYRGPGAGSRISRGEEGTEGRWGPFQTVLFSPEWAADCSRGWSLRPLQSGRSATRGSGVCSTSPPRPGRRKRRSARRITRRRTARRTGPGIVVPSLVRASPSPRRGEKRERNLFSANSAFHGFRVGSPRDRAAPPAATTRRPVGAKDRAALFALHPAPKARTTAAPRRG